MNEQVGVTGRPDAGLCEGFVSVRGRGVVDGGGDGVVVVVVGGAGCTRLDLQRVACQEGLWASCIIHHGLSGALLWLRGC
ncbi:hypothetical protein E2C01_036390 [Portunus trituberculatus]|uniref:Uncharacterized protein n=1 Tax=Portunus trituberculatus TaxID=210409 RepID=A0A5B7FCB7_PORTR|nr:hypothetical protein [Portunus trituberculatus]